MKCSDLITTFIADYVDGTLPPETRAEFERHLEECSSCRAYLRTYRKTIAMAAAAGTAPRLDVQDVPEDLIKAILQVRPS
jgi:anti-sigma factor RsiW